MFRAAVAFLLAWGLLTTTALPSAAETVAFPPPLTDPSDANIVEKAFQARSESVIRFNACGREVEYSQYRVEMVHENYEHQGEGLLAILIGKIAFLTDPRFSGQDCTYKHRSTKARNPQTGEVVDDETFRRSVLGAFLDELVPSRCSVPTSSATVNGDEMTMNFVVTRSCLREQVNNSVKALVKDSQMGTNHLVCMESFPSPDDFLPKGDFDVVVRNAVRVLYMGTIPRREVLDSAAVTALYENVLAARGGLSDPEYSQIAGCNEPAGDELGTPEDYADRRRWYNDLLSAPANFFEWLMILLARTGIGMLASGPGMIAAPFLALAGEDPGEFIAFDIAVGETENHRLMIEGSKFLTNAAIIKELERIDHPTLDELRDDQKEVREWLLKKMRDIVLNDFEEYNSRPYTRYSLNAILNLYDFADDDQIRTAARNVLDYSAAKMAAGSNRARRIVPFRRRAEYDWKPLYNMVEGTDHEVTRAVMLTGQTQLMPGGVEDNGVKNMIYAATSRYRLPEAILQTAVERNAAFSQRIANPGSEGYFSSPAFTVSLGGTKSPSVLSLFGISKDVDKGAAMPTVIIPTSRGTEMEHLFYFAGRGEQHLRSDNTCGWEGFICGIGPHMSTEFTCGQSEDAGQRMTFVNSAKCGNGPHFYLAAQRFPCTVKICGTDNPGTDFGIMEIVEAPNAVAGDDPNFARFRDERSAAFRADAPTGDGTGTYRTAAGDVVAYSIGPQSATVTSANGSSPSSQTRGSIINSDGSGRVAITSPSSGASVTLDFTNWANPQRTSVP